MSQTMTRPPPLARSAAWNACTSATRRDAAVISTLHGMTLLRFGDDVVPGQRLTGGNRAAGAAAEHEVDRVRRNALRRTQRDHVSRHQALAGEQRAAGVQPAPARREVHRLRRQAAFAAITDRLTRTLRGSDGVTQPLRRRR